MIGIGEIAEEAWRNFVAGATRPVISIFLLTIVIGGLGGIQAFSFAQVNRDAAGWRQIGASTQIVTLPERIDGSRCEDLAKIPGVAASGAVRSGNAITLAVLPSTTFNSFEATPGMADLLRVEKLDPAGAKGVWISADLATALGANESGGSTIATTEGSDIDLAGRYQYPEDGRLPVLAYNLISEVPAEGIFDSCWVEVWPEAASTNDLLTYPIILDASSPRDTTPDIQQLNSSKGSSFNGSERANRIPAWLFLFSSMLAGVVIGFTLAWMRRLELASMLHAGVSKAALCLQVLVELLLAALPTVLLSLTMTLFLATLNNPGSLWPAFIAASGVIAAGLMAALIGSVAATLSVSEKRLFHYFKTR